MTNARSFLNARDQYGSFADYLWGFVDGRSVVNRPITMADVPVRTELSDRVGQKDLKHGLHLRRLDYRVFLPPGGGSGGRPLGGLPRNAPDAVRSSVDGAGSEARLLVQAGHLLRYPCSAFERAWAVRRACGDQRAVLSWPGFPKQMSDRPQQCAEDERPGRNQAKVPDFRGIEQNRMVADQAVEPMLLQWTTTDRR